MHFHNPCRRHFHISAVYLTDYGSSQLQERTPGHCILIQSNRSAPVSYTHLGEAEFQLVFPPLSDNATSFDFTEGEKVENGFSVWGIQLKSKKLPELALPQNLSLIHI